MEVFLFILAGWVFSVCLHEYGHALVAFRGGDYTVQEKGYLTFNPLRYTHPLTSLVIPVVFLLLGGIGLPGGAVYIERHLLRSKQWETAVSLAGPAMNLLLILVLALPFWLGLAGRENSPTLLSAGLALLIQLQICAVLFNLLPVPPLDGFQALMPWMKVEMAERFLENSNMAFWVLVLVMWYVPPVSQAFWSVVHGASDLIGIDPHYARLGWYEFQFWRR